MTGLPFVLPNSFCTFLHPFRLNAEAFDAIVARVEADVRKGRNASEKVWIRHSFQNEDLLPHVAKFLNTPQGNQESRAITQSWDMGKVIVDDHEWLGAKGEWAWEAPGTSDPIRIHLTEVNLTLFRTGLGFFRFRVAPDEKDRALTDWQNFLHHFRFIEGRRSGVIRARRQTGKDQWESFRPGLLPPPESGSPILPEFRFGELVRELEKRYCGEPQPSIYIKGQAIPYAGLFIENLPEDQHMLALHRMKNFFKISQGEDAAPQDLDPGCEDFLRYSASSWFVFSLDGAGFVSFDPPNTPFFRETLPDHLVRDQYYLLFLLVQQQRLLLMNLSEDVSSYWDTQDLDRQERLFDRLRDRLLFFTSKGHFHQVMQREHHHRVYRLWQKKLQIHELYEEVTGEIQDIHERTLLKIQKRVEERANWLNNTLFVIGPASLAVGLMQTVGTFLSTTEPSKAAWKLGVQIGVGSLLIGFGLGICLLTIHRLFTKLKMSKQPLWKKDH